MNPRSFPVQRPLVCVAACFGAGVFAGVQWTGGALWMMPLGAVLSLALIALQRLRGQSLLFGACLLALFAGMGYAYPRAHPPLPPEGKYLVTARVSGESELRAEDGRVKTLLRQVRLVDGEGRSHSLSGAYWTFYPGEEVPLPVDSQTAAFSARLYHPAGQANPYGFDFRAYLQEKDIPVGLTGADGLRLSPEHPSGPASPWLRARQRLGSLFDAALGEEGALARALVIGDRSELSEDTSRAFELAGVAHVLSVSGLHVGLMMGALLFVLGRFNLPHRTRLAVAAAVLFLYCRLLDFSAPVVRASVLTLMMLLGRSVGRRSDPLTSLSAAFMLILLMRPLELFSIGFQLSFLAVLGILTLGAQMGARIDALAEAGRLPRLLRGPLKAYAVTLSAALFTALPTVLSFHRFSLMGLLAGPAVCALVGVLMTGFLILSPAALCCLPLARTLAVPLALLCRGFRLAMDRLAAPPWASLRLASPRVLSVAAAYLCLLLLSRYSLLKLRPRLLAGGLAFAAAFAFALWPGEEGVRYIQLSAGQADAAVIEDGKTTYVIDTGEHGGDLASYLLSRGRKADRLFLTHLHGDHAGGLRQLLDSRVPIGEILLPFGAGSARVAGEVMALVEEAAALGIPLRTLGAGDSLAGERLRMRVLWPVRDRLYPGMDANHGSLAMLWDLDGVLLMTTGDLTGEYEGYAACPAHVLKVAHHGSGQSTGEAFLAAVSPQAALLSGSDRSRLRSAEVLKRLEGLGIPVLDTGIHGALTLTCREGSLLIAAYLSPGGDNGQ